MTFDRKGLLKLIASVYLIWHIGVFFSFFSFWGHNQPIGYGAMIVCIVLYALLEKKHERTER